MRGLPPPLAGVDLIEIIESMNMEKIACVVFDIGNVLIRWDPRNVYRRMGYTDAATSSIMAETGLGEINHRVLDVGAPFGATLAKLADRFPQHAEFILAFDTRWADMVGGAVDDSVVALRDLRRAGYPVYGLSNFSREKFDVVRVMFPFLDEFDHLVVSADVGMVKPDAEIFELLIERTGLEPARALFIDDSADNIAAAKRIGFDTVLFKQDETDLQAEFARRGVSDGKTPS